MAMKILHIQTILISILMLSGCAQYDSAVEKLEWLEPDTFTCDIVQVKSGDTFLCKFADMEIDTIMLAGISIPPDKTAQAKRFSESVLRRGILVNIEPDKNKRARNGGIHAYVFVPGGKMLNTLLVEKGYAEAVAEEVNVKYKSEFFKIEDNRGEETEVMEEIETDKKPWVK